MKRLYQVAFSKIPEVKKTHLKTILEVFGSPNLFFESSKQERMQKGLNPMICRKINEKKLFKEAEVELKYIEKEGINMHFYDDITYPKNLRECEDAPVLIYTKGNVNLNPKRCVSVVGTRLCTSYGKDFCEAFVSNLSEREITVVSGLAYGIDVCAHRQAMKSGLATMAVLGHNFNSIYPSPHSNTAAEMMQNGGLITEFDSTSETHRGNFPSRNRIIAGIADATVVIESKNKGGSLITADIANSYNREVFAVPGRVTDLKSVGCNKLIQENLAILLESATDFLNFMNWNDKKKEKQLQTSLDFELSKNAVKLLEILSEKGEAHIDELSAISAMPASAMASVLMELELRDLVRPMPGNRYKMKGLVKY